MVKSAHVYYIPKPPRRTVSVQMFYTGRNMTNVPKITTTEYKKPITLHLEVGDRQPSLRLGVV